MKMAFNVLITVSAFLIFNVTSASHEKKAEPCVISGLYNNTFSNPHVFYTFSFSQNENSVSRYYEVLNTLYYAGDEDGRTFVVHTNFSSVEPDNKLKIESISKELVQISLPLIVEIDEKREPVLVNIEAKNLKLVKIDVKEYYAPIGPNSYKISARGHVYESDGASFTISKSCMP